MKKFLFFILVSFFTKPIIAQQDAQFSSYLFNKLIYNPAYAGSKEALSLNTTYRHQWAGMEGAPRTINLSMNTPFFDNRCGLGISLLADRIGLMERTGIDVSYAYRLALTKNNILSFGLNANMTYGRIRWNQTVLSEEGDELIPNSDSGLTSPNFGLGIYYSSKSMYLGFSIPRIFNSTPFDYGSSSQHQNSQSYYAMTGWIKRLNKSLVFKPSIFINYTPNIPLSTTLAANMIFMDVLWLGIAYRIEDSMDAIVQYQFNKQFKAGLAVDFTTSALNQYTTGSLEFMLEYNFIFQPSYKDHLRFF